jgi:hypothetical protein
MSAPVSSDPEFYAALRAEDPLGAVVRTHIHIEARLNTAIRRALPRPDELPSLRFEQRVRLALCLGFEEGLVAPLIELGRIRNAFSHRLDVTLTDAMVNTLFASFSQSQRQLIVDAYEMTNKDVGVKDAPPYDKADARLRFLTIAVAMDTLVKLAGEALVPRVA